MKGKESLESLVKKGTRYFCLTLLFSLLFTTRVFAAENRSANFKKAYTLTGNQSSDMVAVAKAQIGQTKGSLGYKSAWCAFFVLDCARLANIPADVIPYNYSNAGGCSYLYNYMLKNCKAAVTTSPQPGDLTFYYCNSCKKYVHVGIYMGSGIGIEGNVSGQVLKYNTLHYLDSGNHSVSSGVIRRIYVHPNYKKSISSCSIVLSASSYAYTGSAVIPGVTVKYGSYVLKLNTDYTVSFTNNVNAGTASAVFTGKGNFAGTKTVTFRILPKAIGSVSCSGVSNMVYTGKQIRPSVVLKHGTRVLSAGTHYTVSYGTNKNTGAGTVTITGKGNYSGSRVIRFYIVPKQVTGLKLRVSRRTLTVTYQKSAGATGYQIAYRKKGSGKWYTTNSSMISKKLSLGALTNYEVRVRAFVQVKIGTSVQKQYGAWSTTAVKRTLI